MIVNGQKQSHIAIADRSVQYGDGCFTTIACTKGQLELFDAHILRLQHACERLSIPFTDWHKLQESALNSVKQTDLGVVKIMITRGEGGRGYNPVGASEPNFIISHHVLPDYYQQWQQSGIHIGVSPVTLACQPLLAGIKHLNRLEQVLIKQALASTSYNDVIVCDTTHNLIESSVGNIFWLKNNRWFTPDLSESGVEGVMRNLILSEMSKKGMHVQEVKQPIESLYQADEVFICNSLMKVVPVVSIVAPNTGTQTTYAYKQVCDIQHLVNEGIAASLGYN